MNDSESNIEDSDEYISEDEIEEDPDAIIRSRIKTKITTGIKIKRIIFWALYIMAFYYFAARNSKYEQFIAVTGIAQVDPGLKFLLSLLILVICANIAGPIAGGIGAMLGDLVFQLVTTKTIRIEYLLVVILIGVGSGLFRFNREETLKKLKVMKFFYSLVATSIISVGVLFLVAWIRYPTLNWDSELGHVIQYNYIQFLFAELVSYLFLAPLFIAFLDRVLRWASKPDGVAYRFFFTHHYEEQADHAVPLDLGGYQFFLCTRCSGTVSGIIFMVFIDYSMLEFNNGVEIISPIIALILCIVFTLPAIVDWGTQKMQFRTSNDTVRFITGLFLGAAIHMLVLAIDGYLIATIVVLVVYFAAFFIMFFIGNRRLRKMVFNDWKKKIKK